MLSADPLMNYQIVHEGWFFSGEVSGKCRGEWALNGGFFGGCSKGTWVLGGGWDSGGG